jgi:hypothetical protein
MSRGGIIFQPIVFEPGPVATVSPGPPGGGVGGGPGSGGGGGGSVGPILAGLLLLLGALGFSPAGGGPTPSAQQAAPPAPAAPPAAAPPAAAMPVAPAAPPGPTPAVLPSGPGPVASAPLAPSPEQPGRGLRRRPALPFTGANLLTPMVLGAGLILLGLVMRRAEDSAPSP